MKFRTIYIVFLVTLLIPFPGVSQVNARVAGLEKNSEYMALLQKEHQLQQAADSLTKVIEATRIKFRNDSTNRVQYRDDILRLESEIFEVRNEIGITANRIGIIEQEYIINNLGAHSNVEEAPADTIAKPAYVIADLTANEYFKAHLTPADYTTLVTAQAREPLVVNYLKTYAKNYSVIADITEQYRLTTDEIIADSLFRRYHTLDGLNERIADTVSSIWGYIYDNKTYIYSYLLDEMNRTDLLSQFEEKTIKARDRAVTLQDQGVAEPLAAYTANKPLILDYEKTMAELLQLDKAQDSLRRAASESVAMDYLLPVITLEQRYFYDYSDVDWYSPAKYNTKNPIPPTRIFPKGAMYRILLGTYQKAQLPTIFRGVYPMSYTESEEAGYRYFAGGYATQAEAEEAAARLKGFGFRNPQVVVWQDGEYTNLSERQAEELSQPQETLYRIEISGIEEDLSEGVKEVLQAQAADKEISRLEGLFIISSFDSESEANQLVEAIRAVDPDIEIKIAEIAS